MGDFGKLNFSISFNRTSAFPLEANSYFTNLEQAEAAAKTAVEPGSADSTYYIGQTLTVADETDCNLYIINPDQSLKQLTMLDTPDITWENILNKPTVFNTNIDNISDLHSSWDNILKSQKPTTLSGYGITDAYTKTESDSRFVNVSGDTMTGNLQINSSNSSNGMLKLNSVTAESSLSFFKNGTPYITFGITSYANDSYNSNYLGFYDNANIYGGGNKWYKIWHAGNDGSGSGLDADMLDSYNETAFPRLVGIMSGIWNWNDINRAGYYKIQGGIISNHPSGIYEYGMSEIITTENHADGENRILQIYYPHSQTNNIALWVRMHNSSSLGSGWGDWIGIPNINGSIAFSNNSDTVDGKHYSDIINGNVYSATKLQTGRYLWGQYFDGQQNVSGTLSDCYGFATNWYDVWSDGTNTHPWYGYDHRYNNTGVFSTTISDYFGLCFRTQDGYLVMNSAGNVGIGTTSPSQKLHVDGNILATGELYANTSNKVWHAGNDGSGSGLDADLLDGLHANNLLYSFNDNDFDPNTYDGYYVGMTTKSGISTDWWHILSMNWGKGNTTGNKIWASQLALPTQGRTGIRYRSGNWDSAYQPWVKVWDESNDGSGSGLDADLLDGKHYADIVNGNVASATRLQTPRSLWGQSFDGQQNISGNMTGVGSITASSSIYALSFYENSDINLKTNIQPLDFTNNIELVSFNWKKDGSKSYGVIAQQVEQYYPELVSTDESTGYKSVNYDAVLIIKCAQLENRIKQLEKELEDLKYGKDCN